MRVLYDGKYIELNDDSKEKDFDRIAENEFKSLEEEKELENTFDYSELLGDENGNK